MDLSIRGWAFGAKWLRAIGGSRSARPASATGCGLRRPGIESRRLKVARFGDNMRHVAVTEGDKVEAQIRFGWSVNGYGVGDLVAAMNDISDIGSGAVDG